MIYLLEDEENIRKLAVYALNSQNLETTGYERPSQFWAAMEKQRPELVLLDIMLPEEDGISVLEKMRADPLWRDIPVIMLTAKNTEYDKVVGLDAGADDYIAKPFGMMELAARVRAVLRRSDRIPHTEEWQYKDLYVNVGAHIVKVKDEEVVLTLKEFELLTTLLKNRGIVQTRDNLLSQIWGYEFDGESRTLDVHVRTLRQKLGEAGEYIETVRGVGYKIE